MVYLYQIEDVKPARILFRSTRGVKKQKMNEASESSTLAPQFTSQDEIDEEKEEKVNSSTEEKARFTFRTRRSRHTTRKTHLNDDDNADDDADASEASPGQASLPREILPSIDDFEERDDDDEECLEDAPEGL